MILDSVASNDVSYSDNHVFYRLVYMKNPLL